MIEQLQPIAGAKVTLPRELTILLVEDDVLQQARARRAFAQAGVTCPLFMADDGTEALELLRSGQIPTRHLVLLDVHMSPMSGLEFLREVRSDPALKSLVVVMLTTSEAVEDKAEALAWNVAGYLLKESSSQKFAEQLGAVEKYWSMMEIP